MLEEKLGDAVRIHRLSNSFLGNRDKGWFPINRAGGGKDYLLHSGIDGGVQQGKPSFDIVMEVFSRVRDRFADVSVSRKMHNGIHAAQGRQQRSSIQDVAFDKFKPLRQGVMAGREIVVD